MTPAGDAPRETLSRRSAVAVLLTRPAHVSGQLLSQGNFATASVTVRSVGGRSHIFAAGMYAQVHSQPSSDSESIMVEVFRVSSPAQGPAWYRREGEANGSASEIAVPCGLFSKDAGVVGAWPATEGAPVGSGFVWQDDDGDGLMRAAEFTALSGLRLGGVWGSWEDESGNLWVVSEDHWMLGELPLVRVVATISALSALPRAAAWAPSTSLGGCLRYNFSAAPLVNLTADLPPLVQVRR